MSRRAGARPAWWARALRGVALTVACALGAAAWPGVSQAAPEKREVVVGFLKQLDMAPLALAAERGYFEDAGLSVRLVEARNWGEMALKITDGVFDAGQILATQPVASAAGLLDGQRFIAPLILSANGTAVTVSNEVWRSMARSLPLDAEGRPKHPIPSTLFLEALESLKSRDRQMQLGVDHALSPANYVLRYWIAAGGGHPGYYGPDAPNGDKGADVALLEFPPVFMPLALKAQLLDGYSVSAPWGQQALILETGLPIVTQDDVTPLAGQTVLGVTERFAKDYPRTVLALTKAVLRACRDLQAEEGRLAAAALLRRPEYLGLSNRAMRHLADRTYEHVPGDRRERPRFSVFFGDRAAYPYLSDAVWYLTQMRRWGQIAERQTDAWYWATARAAYRPDIYQSAITALAVEGHATLADVPNDPGVTRKVGDQRFIDGVTFDPRSPNAYLERFGVGLKGEERVEAASAADVEAAPASALISREP